MKQGPYCNAQMADESKFCGECGKEYPQGNTCPHCGARVYEGDAFCQNCGRNLTDGSYASSDYGEKSSMDYMKILLSSLIGIVIGLVILALVGGSWYGYNAYSEYTAAKQAREKFVADSIEQVRKDSIKLAEQKEQERIEAERISAMREELSWERVLALMNNIKNKSLAKKCGLEEIYKYEYTNDDEECPESEEVIIYGREVRKGTVSNGGYNVQIISNSDHSCYLEYSCASDCGYIIAFKDSEDANYFFNQVTENGVFKSNDSYLIPKKKKFKGIRESDNWEYEDIAYGMSEVQYSEGWHRILFYPY